MAHPPPGPSPVTRELSCPTLGETRRRRRWPSRRAPVDVRAGYQATVYIIALCVVSSLVDSSVALMRYVPGAVFDPADYGVQTWPAVTTRPSEVRGLGPDWYNPAMAWLAPEVRQALSARIGRNASFLMAFKRNLQKGNCWNLMDNSSATNQPGPDAKSLWGDDLVSDHMSQQFVLVDDLHRAIRPALKVVGDPWVLDILRTCGDIRLEPGKHPTHILAHAHVRKVYPFWWVELVAAPFADAADDPDDARRYLPGVVAKVTRFAHRDVATPETPWLAFRAQNIGIMWNGHRAAPFRLLYWLDDQFDVRAGIPPKQGEPRAEADVVATPSLPPPPSEHNQNRSLTTFAARPWRVPAPLGNRVPAPYGPKSLHNSGSPIDVGDWCPDLGVALGHTHLDAAAPHHTKNEVRAGATRWGNTYIYNFVLFNTTPPFAAIATSPPFCFPSIATTTDRRLVDAPKCDIIQFVSTFARRLHSPKVFIGYGVNDCESLVHRLTLEELLNFTDPTLFARGACRRPTPRALGYRPHFHSHHLHMSVFE